MLKNLLKAMLATIGNQRGSIGVYFDGRRLIRPQAATKIDDSGMYARGLGGGNTLALIGEATGGKPGVVQWFTDPSYAKAILRGGSLLQAVQRAYDPSSEVNGAYLVGAIRVNPATQARLALTDTNSNPIIILTSLDYGIWNNQVKTRVQTGTGSVGKKLTFTYGTTYDQGDTIEKKSIYLGCGLACTTATMTITQGTSTKTLTTTINGGAGLDIDLSDYPTIQELTDYLDAQTGYEAYPATLSPETELSAALDSVSGANLLAIVTTLSENYETLTSTTLHVASESGFAKGDYIIIARTAGTAEETRRIASTPTTGHIEMDSALSTTYVSGSYVRKVVTLKSDVQAIINWVNEGNTGYVTAAYPSTTWASLTAYIVGDVRLPSVDNDRCHVCSVAGTSGATEPSWSTTPGNTTSGDGGCSWVCRTTARGTILNIPDTYMLGGSEGTTTQTHWDNALETLQAEDTQLISCVTYDPSVWAALSTHCSYMSTVGKKERIGFCGGFATADGYNGGLGKWTSTTLISNSITQMETYAGQLNTDRLVYVGPGFKAYDENGVLYTYNGAISAALVAGMAAGVDVAEALTHKTIKAIGLEYNLKWANLDRLLELGVCPLEYEPGFGYRVCQSITTWLRNDKYNRRELSVRRTADYIARQVRDRLERDFVGTKGTLTTLISIKNAVISVLQQMYRAELLAGDTNNPPYKNIQCRLEGDTCWVDFECSPVIPINYIPIVIHLTVYTATVVA